MFIYLLRSLCHPPAYTITHQHSASFVRNLPWPAGRESTNSHYRVSSAVTETGRTINNYSFKMFPKGTAMLLNNADESVLSHRLSDETCY